MKRGAVDNEYMNTFKTKLLLKDCKKKQKYKVVKGDLLIKVRWSLFFYKSIPLAFHIYNLIRDMVNSKGQKHNLIRRIMEGV